VTAHTVSGPTVTGPGISTVHGTSPPSAFEPAILDRLTHALAPYLGPIAKVLVNRAARRVRNVNELQEALATEIPSPDDRRQFLARVRSAL
jgi:eukaryotic-like serine/threonine-protein kinase